MDKAARLAKIKGIAQLFKANNASLVGQKIKIVEVGARDGLQNQKQLIPLQEKIELIDKLSMAGLPVIQVGSFVSPKWVPQMSNSTELFQKITKKDGVVYPCLVPNSKGMETAVNIGVKEVAIFASATQGFSKKNLNCSIEQSLQRFEPVMKTAKQKQMKVRGYVSMVMGCPYDGQVKPSQVRWVVQKLFDMGCYEVSLGDTVGQGTPTKTSQLFEELSKAKLPVQKLAAHFHDTFDNAIQNIFTAIEHGVRTVDTSVGGLGGCPYAMKPVGNVCTENVVFALEEAGLSTGVNLQKLNQIGKQICSKLQRPSLSVL